MNYGGPQDQRYGGGQSLTDGYDYDGEKNYYSQQGQQAQQLPSFPSFSNMRGTQQPPSHPYHGGLHQSSPSLLGERVLPPMSSVARGGPSSMSSGGGGPDMGVSALSAAAAAHQMSRLGEAFKDSLVHQMGKSSSPSGSLGGPGPSSYGLTQQQQQQQPYGMSTSGHSDRLYGGSANPFPNHGGALSGGSGSLSEKSSPRSSTQRSSGEAGYGLPTVTTRGSGDRGVQLPAPSISTQIGANGAAHQAAVSLSHIASGAGSQLHPSSTSVSAQQPTTGRTAASMNPKDLLELYSKWDQLDNKAKSKNEEVHAEEVRKERHNMAEKRRRSDMNGAIERLKTLLPQQVTNDRRLTKVEVLTEAADHLTQVQNLCAKLITENKRLKALVPGVKMEDDDAFLTRGNEDDAAGAASTNSATSDSSGSGSNSGDDVSSHEDERERRPATADERCNGDGGDGSGGFGDGQQQPPAKRLRRSSPGDSSSGSGSDNGSDSGASSSSESASTENPQRHNTVVGAPRSRHNSVGSDSQQSGSASGDDGRGERDSEGAARVPSDDDGRTLPHHHHVIDEGVEGRDSDNSNDGIPTASTSKRRRTASASDNQGEPTTFAGLHFPSSATSSTPSTSSSTSNSLSSSSSAAEMSAAYGHHYHQQHYGGGSGGLGHHQPQQQQQHFGGGGGGNNGGGLSHHLQQQQQPHPYHHHPQHHM